MTSAVDPTDGQERISADAKWVFSYYSVVGDGNDSGTHLIHDIQGHFKQLRKLSNIMTPPWLLPTLRSCCLRHSRFGTELKPLSSGPGPWSPLPLPENRPFWAVPDGFALRCVETITVGEAKTRSTMAFVSTLFSANQSRRSLELHQQISLIAVVAVVIAQQRFPQVYPPRPQRDHSGTELDSTTVLSHCGAWMHAIS